MNGTTYDELFDIEDEPTDFDEEEEDFDTEDVDEMLDALVESADQEEDFAERSRRRRRGRKRQRKGVKTAGPGSSYYRSPGRPGFVTQKQLQESLGRVGVDVRRNAQGIKTVNTRLNGLGGKVDAAVAATTVQGRRLTKINNQMKAAGALDVVQALTQTPGQLEVVPLFRAAVSTGMIGGGKGALGNPWVIGGIGLLLSKPNILGGGLFGAPNT